MATNLGIGAIPAVGERWPHPSLVWGSQAGSGDEFEAKSAQGPHTVQAVGLLSPTELASLFATAPIPPPTFDSSGFCSSLAQSLKSLKPALTEALRQETGFLLADAEEVVAATIQFLYDAPSLGASPAATRQVCAYETPDEDRRIDLASCPWGLVSVILPHNAFLPLAVACSVFARIAGNAVVLRAPLQSSRSAALLALALRNAGQSDCGISVVIAQGREFIDAHLSSPTPSLLHFFGSSTAISSLLPQCFAAGKSAIFDGQGNVWAYVGKSHSAATVDRLVSGAFRYNGQTCTSINGIIVHPDVYDSIRDQLRQKKEDLTGGHLFDAAQAEACVQSVVESGGRVLVGGTCEGSLLQPTLVEDPDPGSSLVREGVFGGVVWVKKGDSQAFASMWPSNRYPLCAAVFEDDAEPEEWLNRLPNVARLCINGDPSLEDLFEPWGGYGGSGTSPVQSWVEKYSRPVQIDRPV
jgi:acyl-CoA reductase-like NAD-dependent aldehyde dehydrogenase